MKKIMFMLMLLAVPCFAAFDQYILIPIDRQTSMVSRLDEIVQGIPGTDHYTYAIPAQNPPEYPFVLMPIDNRAKSVLTPEEWDSRLATIPVEFLRPIP